MVVLLLVAAFAELCVACARREAVGVPIIFSCRSNEVLGTAFFAVALNNWYVRVILAALRRTLVQFVATNTD